MESRSNGGNSHSQEALPEGGIRRIALLATGWTCVGLGTLGMFLPVLPTTCFLLGAGACFARSSPRAHRWLYGNRWFGRHLRDYREHGVIPVRAKLVSLAVLWVTILATVVAVPNPWVRTTVLAIAAVITLHVARTASSPPCPAPELARDGSTG